MSLKKYNFFTWTGIVVFTFIFFWLHPAFSLSPQEIIDLKNAGVQDKTIELIIHQQADLTGLISVPEVIRMKKAGISDDVIRAMASPPASHESVREYGMHVDQIKEISTEDLVQLKKAGFDDTLIQAIIKIQREDRWPFLFNLGLITCP